MEWDVTGGHREGYALYVLLSKARSSRLLAVYIRGQRQLDVFQVLPRGQWTQCRVEVRAALAYFNPTLSMALLL